MPGHRPFAACCVAASLVAATVARGEIGDAIADVVLGQTGFADAVALPIGPSSFARPRGVAIDRHVVPNRVFVSDSVYHRVLGWSDADALADGAPADLVIGQSDFTSWGCNRAPYDSGVPPTPSLSSVCEPTGMAVDGAGTLWVADSRNCRILGFQDPFGTDAVADVVIGQPGCDGVTVTAGKMFEPQGVAVDAAGNLFVADTLNCRVLEFDGPFPGADAVADRVYGQPSFTSRACGAGNIPFPAGLAVDAAGTLWVGGADVVRGYTNALSDTTADRTLGTNGCNMGGENASSTCGPLATAVDAAGRLYVADAGNSRVLAFNTPLTVAQAARVFGQPDFSGTTTFTHDACNTGGPSADSLCLQSVSPDLVIGQAAALAVDGSGRLWVADGLNHRVLRYDTPLADSTADLVLGQPAMSSIRQPTVPLDQPGVAVDNSQFLAVVLDRSGNRVLVYQNLGDAWPTPVAVVGQPDFASSGCNTGGRSAASLCAPGAATVDVNGNLWVADTGNDRVLEYDAPWVTYDTVQRRYVVRQDANRVFGQPDFASAGCAAGASGLCAPEGVALDAAQTLFVADTGNNRIVHHQNPLADATAERVYGQADFTGTLCNRGGATPGATTLCAPRGLAIDGAGGLAVADHDNHRVLHFPPPAPGEPTADRIVGQPGGFTTSVCGGGTDGLCDPSGVAFDRRDDLVVADTGNNRVLVFDASPADGTADRVFGQADFAATSCGPTSAQSLCQPTHVAVSNAGDALLVADAGNHRVVRYDAPYCIDDFVLDATTAKLRDVSRPIVTKLTILNGPASADDAVKLTSRLVLLERDGGVSAGYEPLLTLSSSGGIAWQERVPFLRNIRVTSSGGTWDTTLLPGDVDHGIDRFRVTERFVIPGNDAKPQYDKLDLKGHALGLELSGFTAPTASFRVAYGSTCFTTQLACTTNARGRACKPVR